jgi:hypothetical protein
MKKGASLSGAPFLLSVTSLLLFCLPSLDPLTQAPDKKNPAYAGETIRCFTYRSVRSRSNDCATLLPAIRLKTDCLETTPAGMMIQTRPACVKPDALKLT